MDDDVLSGKSNLETGGERDGTRRAVRDVGHVESLRHRDELTHLSDAADIVASGRMTDTASWTNSGLKTYRE